MSPTSRPAATATRGWCWSRWRSWPARGSSACTRSRRPACCWPTRTPASRSRRRSGSSSRRCSPPPRSSPLAGPRADGRAAAAAGAAGRPARGDGRLGRRLARRLPPLHGPPPRARASAADSWRSSRSGCTRSRRGGRSSSIGAAAAPSRSAMAVAFVLLAEAMVAVVVSRNWHLSWWEWHLLLLAAFAAIALGARSEYRRGGSLAGRSAGCISRRRSPGSTAGTRRRSPPWPRRMRGASRPTACSPDLRRDGASDGARPAREAARELRRLDRHSGRTCQSSSAQGILRRARRRGSLGGEEREVTVLFADLAGFTTFSETRSPTEVVAMLNEFWGVVVPAIDAGRRRHRALRRRRGDGHLQRGGDQPDHAQRAAGRPPAIVAAPRAGRRRPTRAGRSSASASTPGRRWSAVVGRRSRRSFAAIGDADNTAARLMAAGGPGRSSSAGRPGRRSGRPGRRAARRGPRQGQADPGRGVAPGGSVAQLTRSTNGTSSGFIGQARSRLVERQLVSPQSVGDPGTSWLNRHAKSSRARVSPERPRMPMYTCTPGKVAR